MGATDLELAETIPTPTTAEVMRLQRGRHEVKLMVRYPARPTQFVLAGFNDIRVRAGDRVERPITELAGDYGDRGYSTIMRLDQMRAISVPADVDLDATSNAKRSSTAQLENHLPNRPARRLPAASVNSLEGQQKQRPESIAEPGLGLAMALACMFALLALEFRSYFQPMLILAIVPFGVIGAILGHWILGLPVYAL